MHQFSSKNDIRLIDRSTWQDRLPSPILGNLLDLRSHRCTPSYTDQKCSRPSVACSFAKMVAKVLQINSKFCDFLQWLHLNNYLAWQYLAWFYKRGKHGLCKRGYLDVAIVKKLQNSLLICSTFTTMFCQCNSQKLVAKIFGQCKSAATITYLRSLKQLHQVLGNFNGNTDTVFCAVKACQKLPFSQVSKWSK